MNPSGTKSAQPSIAPPNETLSSTIREKTTRLWTFISGVRPERRAEGHARGDLARRAVRVQRLDDRLDQLEQGEHEGK